MSFPTSPTNGQTTTINGITYSYSTTDGAWTRVSGNNIILSGYANIATSVNSALLTVGTSFIANTTGAYHTGVVNAASHTVGSSFVANSSQVTTTGQIVSTRTGSAADANGQIYLNGGTSNRIDWAATGVGAPSVSTRSSGTKLVLYPAVAAASVDFGMGIDTNVLWSSVADTGDTFKWYANTTLLFDANTSGITVGSGGIFPTSNSSATSLGSATQRWVLNANTISASGLINGSSGLIVTGTANVSVAFNLGSSFTANTTGAYHTGLVNAASINTGSVNAASIDIGSSGFVANSTAIVLAEPVTANGATGTSGQVLTSNGTTGSPYWATVSAGLSIGGSNTQIQFNNSGVLGGDALLTFNNTTDILTVGNTTIGSISSGVASPSSVRAIQSEKVYSTDVSPAGAYIDTIRNNATLTAARSVVGVQAITVSNTADANSTGGIQGSDGYGIYSVMYNGETVTDNARINNMYAGYFIARNYAGGATANTVDAAHGGYFNVGVYGSGNITTAYGSRVVIAPANTTVAGDITTAYGYFANVQSNTASAIATGYLYYGIFNGTNYTTKYGLYLTGESNNYVSSDITIGGNAYAVIFSATSDERLKTNIEIVDNPVEKIGSLRGVTFTYAASNTQSIGVIAQDVEKQMPELVNINSEGFRQVNYNGIVGVLVEAVKQQQKQINYLTEQLELLRGTK